MGRSSRARGLWEIDPFEAASTPSWLHNPHLAGVSTAPHTASSVGGTTAAERVMRASRHAAQCSQWTLAAEMGAGAEEQAMIREAIKASVADERERRKHSRAARAAEQQKD